MTLGRRPSWHATVVSALCLPITSSDLIGIRSQSKIEYWVGLDGACVTTYDGARRCTTAQLISRCTHAMINDVGVPSCIDGYMLGCNRTCLTFPTYILAVCKQVSKYKCPEQLSKGIKLMDVYTMFAYQKSRNQLSSAEGGMEVISRCLV